jgi:hypothetical protein
MEKQSIKSGLRAAKAITQQVKDLCRAANLGKNRHARKPNIHAGLTRID